MTMRLLNLPLPIFAAALVQQIEPPAVTGPGWVVAVATGAFVVLWFLNAIGKLPGGSSDRREASFKDADRKKLDAMHEVVTCEDADKPGWHMVWYPARETREIRDLLIELSDLREDWAAEREECRKERAAMEARRAEEREEWRAERSRMETRITHLEEVNRIQGHALQHGAGGA